MKLVFILVALCGQPPAKELPAIGTDYPFARAQERFVKESCGVRDFQKVLPRKNALIIRVLGSNSYEARELAERDLDALEGLDQLRTLIWGTFAKDPHIVEICRGRLRTIWICENCDGTGICPVCFGRLETDDVERIRCIHGTCVDHLYNVRSVCLCKECGGTGLPPSKMKTVNPRDHWSFER